MALWGGSDIFPALRGWLSWLVGSSSLLSAANWQPVFTIAVWNGCAFQDSYENLLTELVFPKELKVLLGAPALILPALAGSCLGGWASVYV